MKNKESLEMITTLFFLLLSRVECDVSDEVLMYVKNLHEKVDKVQSDLKSLTLDVNSKFTQIDQKCNSLEDLKSTSFKIFEKLNELEASFGEHASYWSPFPPMMPSPPSSGTKTIATVRKYYSNFEISIKLKSPRLNKVLVEAKPPRLQVVPEKMSIYKKVILRVNRYFFGTPGFCHRGEDKL